MTKHETRMKNVEYFRWNKRNSYSKFLNMHKCLMIVSNQERIFFLHWESVRQQRCSIHFIMFDFYIFILFYFSSFRRQFICIVWVQKESMEWWFSFWNWKWKLRTVLIWDLRWLFKNSAISMHEFGKMEKKIKNFFTIVVHSKTN